MGQKPHHLVLVHTFEFLKDLATEEDTYFLKRMFGCQMICLHHKMCLGLTDSLGKTYRGKKYKVDPWYGVMVITDKASHPALQKQFPWLIPHPVLGKWLFLPGTDEFFEERATELVEAAILNNRSIGIPVKLK
jgi:hypothetical protein